MNQLTLFASPERQQPRGPSTEQPDGNASSGPSHVKQILHLALLDVIGRWGEPDRSERDSG